MTTLLIKTAAAFAQRFLIPYTVLVITGTAALRTYYNK